MRLERVIPPAVVLCLFASMRLPTAAQDVGWKRLNAQVEELSKQGKYTEAIPIAMRIRVKKRYGRDIPLYWGGFVLVGRRRFRSNSL